jgi:hypothetical protein
MTLSTACWACGMAFDAPAHQPILQDLEPTHRPFVQVTVERLPDLQVREVLGRVEKIAPLAIACSTCGSDMTDTTTCPKCGATHDLHAPTLEVVAADAPRACPYCGVLNAPSRSLCVNCAGLLESDDHAE